MDAILNDSPLTLGAIDNAPLLNAVVNETLRLLPPITSGVKRESPGAMICDRVRVNSSLICSFLKLYLLQFIPAGIACRTPNYTLSRDARYFSPAPDSFRPDRWLDTKNEEAFNRLAFFPL